MTRGRTALVTAASLLLMIAGTTWPFVVAVLAPELLVELDLSATLLGLAYASYYLSGSLWSKVAGRIVDRGGFRVASVVLLAAAIIQHVLLASARSPFLLVLSGLLGGLPLALTNPTTNLLVSTLLTGRPARMALGIKQTGVPMSGAFAGFITPLTATLLGWRGAVLVTLALSAAAALLVAGVRGPSGGGPVGNRPVQLQRRFGLERYVLSMGMISSALSGYLVLYLVTMFDGTVQRAGALVAAFAVSGAVGRLVWTAMGGGARTLPILRLLGAIGMVGLGVLTFSTVEWSVWAAVITLGLTVHAWQGLGMLAVVEADRSGTIGATSARVMRDFFIGFVIGAPLTGALIDRVGFRAAWGILIGVAFIAAVTVRLPERAEEPSIEEREVPEEPEVPGEPEVPEEPEVPGTTRSG